MYYVTLVLSALLSVAFLGAGAAKLRRAEPVTGTLVGVGVSSGLQRAIGLLEVLGAAAVVIGLWFEPLGALAAAGLVAMMIGALAFHARARDTVKDSAGAMVLLVFSVAVLSLQVVAA